MSAVLKSDAGTAISVTPLSAHIGAEIGNVDLTRALAPEIVAQIRATLLKWKVVFFRGQNLSHEQHVAFASHFGELTVGHPVFGHVEGHPNVYSVAKHRKANSVQGQRVVRPWTNWHTDVTAAINPPAASILRGVTIPPYGGDTQWTNLETAYQALSAPLRGFVDTLRGVHRFTAPAGTSASKEYSELVSKASLVSEHPLVRVHPETGNRSLFVSPSFLKSVSGLHARESEQLLELLWEHVVRPEFTVRFKWEPGSIAFWDNRSTAHLPPSDIFDLDFDRQLYRVTLVGDVPVGPDGRQSTAIEGDPVLASHSAGY